MIDPMASLMGAAITLAVLLAALILGSAFAEGNFVLWVCGGAITGIAAELWRGFWEDL